MDEEQLRAELRGLIAEEVHQQLSQYRGAVSAELKFMDKELETGLKAIKGKFNSLGNEIRDTVLQNAFTGPIARGLALISIVCGGLMFAFGEGGSKKAMAGIIFGVGMAVGAVNFLGWLFP